ncbi:MAG: VWA domain-containing protein [gamma proteobacterium symbiont of Bathyaustriella thionipta]|nr:VWA domain-containing protein [gamma proteobacterium symbiont of Bathyaustriella thionipta]MCU7949207.1 VWA domain-containing protein [gamma proteobacterium symbiont of Bathyaustriella thionipta]MCU7954899.1 VWA domain-containing protein [gamma proteobacterium symbiont of Bathyaustriella thionipta]MCU7955774.1 VWA domain-containing protein [gamma proteobacterium symbiont of Bathyaustriella thionipta]MCU7966009.1 VWA domain-containing protein [gamma proteobacterium symbiont of Bathyaustriella
MTDTFTEISPKVQAYRDQLQCSFPQLNDVFADCLEEALTVFTEQGVKDYLSGASMVCMIGRGFEPVLVYLEELPQIVEHSDETMLNIISKCVWDMSRTPNGKAILPFLQSLPEAARRLGSTEQLQHYIDIVFDMMSKSTRSVHGFSDTIPSPGLADFLNQSAYLLNQLSIEGIKNWVDYGLSNYHSHPERQKDYFSLQSADSRAILQRERHGTLFSDNERKLSLYLKALWQDKEHFVPYSEGWDELRKPMPYYDSLGIRIPDVYDDSYGIKGIDRYRATIAHIAAHRRWSEAMIADNLSPFQRVAIEIFEDSRVEFLSIQEYPGLRNLFRALHPIPYEGGCNDVHNSCLRYRLAMLSRGLLDPDHGYKDPVILDFIERFHELMAQGNSNTKEMLQLGVSYIAKTKQASDSFPKVIFEDTEVDYRDDNRHLWMFIEEGDEEEAFDDKRQFERDEHEVDKLPPRHYPEWDYKSKTFRPDWVSLYEALHPKGNPEDINRILAKHDRLAKQLKKLLELLKPQQMVRIRYQEEGSELDLDVAIRSIIDFKSGHTPDPRINMSHRHDGRDVAVMLLLDLSASLHEVPDGCTQSILELSREAVSLLALTIEQLNDPFAIAGFHSDTRHNVRYLHVKGYSEHWDDDVKARLAAMEAGYSTRMGAPIRHAAHYLESQPAEKKLLLILTDGEPADIDVTDEQLLIEDTRKAVEELSSKNIYTHCISLDKKADEYIGDIFGKNGYTVIDHVEKLPEKLPQLFMSLTK